MEDPGFVLIEAAANNVAILSCDSPNGPKDFIKDEANGYAYSSNNNKEFKFQISKINKNNLKSNQVYKKRYLQNYLLKNIQFFLII